jgi:hypothetical protein
LTCGVCRKDFALADIVKFIQHKVLTCNKENYSGCRANNRTAENGGGGGTEIATGDSEAETTSGTNSSPTTTTTTTASAATSETSSTLTRRHSISTTTEVKSLQVSGDNNNGPDSSLVKTELDPSSRKRKVECVDASANTVNSGRPNSQKS